MKKYKQHNKAVISAGLIKQNTRKFAIESKPVGKGVQTVSHPWVMWKVVKVFVRLW